MQIITKTLRAFFHVMLAALLVIALLGVLHFPYDVDAPLTPQEIAAANKYYTEAYQKPATQPQPQSEYETKYIRVSEAEAKFFRIDEQVTKFVKTYNLAEKPVLEIGSGRGYLQDIAQNYTGLDISPSVARFYHKKFVVGSATSMPFADNSFDGIWSIWVFEHVPNPEQAFSEARRVLRDQGLIFLMPAWNCTSWAADGYEVRPYSDFNLSGKLIKASIPIRSSSEFRSLSTMPNRLVRNLVAKFGPTRLRYRRLKPNYEKYWTNDSDAVNSIDSHEALMWFTSRGDECLNCAESSLLVSMDLPLVIRVHKK